MPTATSSSPLRVLVVDDCPDTTAALAILLRCWSHDVRVAHDGPAALETAAGFRPDVVLLDVGLPGMDGYEVARRLRGEVGLARALLVAVTGYGQEADRLSREAGCDRHLLKPVDLDALQGLLASSPRTEAARPAGPAEVAERAAGRLRRNFYLALKNVTCECQEGVLTLRGCLPSYYLKQMAQTAVAGVQGVQRVENRIEVVARG
jgi:CheY-like chemotaxis protein